MFCIYTVYIYTNRVVVYISNKNVTMVSARIPIFVREYLRENDISISQAITEFYENHKLNSLDNLAKKRDEYLKLYIQFKELYIQKEQTVYKKHEELYTIAKQYWDRINNSPIVITKEQNNNWLENKTKQLQREGKQITFNEMIELVNSIKEYEKK